jgi:hypothetical protein
LARKQFDFFVVHGDIDVSASPFKLAFWEDVNACSQYTTKYKTHPPPDTSDSVCSGFAIAPGILPKGQFDSSFNVQLPHTSVDVLGVGRAELQYDLKAEPGTAPTADTEG